MIQDIFKNDSALILAEIVSSYPGLLDGSEVNAPDLVDALTQHLFFNLSQESKDFLKSMIE